MALNISNDNDDNARKYPIAHAYAYPTYPGHLNRGEPFWLVVIPECPHCHQRHTHGGGGGALPVAWPTRSNGHRVPHCTPDAFSNKRGGEARRRAALDAAAARIGGFAQYEIMITLPVPLKVCKTIPEALRFHAIISHPSNHACIVPDGTVV